MYFIEVGLKLGSWFEAFLYRSWFEAFLYLLIGGGGGDTLKGRCLHIAVAVGGPL